MNDFKLLTLNVRGINNFVKRKKLFMWLDREQIPIIFLQETYCVKKNENIINSSWTGRIFHSYAASSHCCGTAVLLNRNFSCKVVDYKTDKQGRIALININYNDCNYTLVSIYAPVVEADRIIFF
jgi:exonuclease III